MKFICNKENLLKSISIIQDIVKDNSLSVLNNIYLKVENNILIIRFSDLNNNGELCFSIEEGKNGELLISFNIFFNVLKKIPNGKIECELIDNIFCIKIEEKIYFKLNIQKEIEKFPIFPEINIDYLIEMEQEKIKEMISSVIFSVSEDSLSELRGVFFEVIENNIILTATNGKIFSNVSDIINNKKQNINGIILFEMMNILRKYLNKGKISFFINKKFIYFQFGEYKFYSSLIDNKYVDYRKSILDLIFNEKIIVDRIRLKEAIDRISIINNDSVIIKLDKNKMILNANKTDVGEMEEIIDCLYEGLNISFVFNPFQLHTFLIAMKDNNIKIEFNKENNKKPVSIKNENNDKIINIISPKYLKEEKK